MSHPQNRPDRSLYWFLQHTTLYQSRSGPARDDEIENMDQMVGKKIQEFTCHFLKFSWFHLCIVRSTLRIFPNSDIHLGIFPLKVDQLFSNLERRVMLHDISVVINKRWPTSWRVLLTGPPKYIVPHPVIIIMSGFACMSIEGSFQILFGETSFFVYFLWPFLDRPSKTFNLIIYLSSSAQHVSAVRPWSRADNYWEVLMCGSQKVNVRHISKPKLAQRWKSESDY